ncbi:MAG: ATP-binding cassette domain-containing protein [Spirochaetales bacterium]|nr:ATP-binding cassette domain-containing protein [Spirochaetales bacterium]
MLEAYNVYFKYDKSSSWVIDDLSITIKPGDVIGLMGKSGCGKTTFARLLSGYINPQKGRVLIDNNPLPKKGYSPVQLISQHPEKAMNPRWKIKKVLDEVKGFTPENVILDSLDLSAEFPERYPHELSGGELQRICLCRILNPYTKYIIADEISGMLDTITQANIWNTLISFASRNNIGILIISHDESLLKRLCNQVIIDLFKS